MCEFDIKWERGLIKSVSMDGIRGYDWGNETSDRKSFYNPVENSFGTKILQERTYTDDQMRNNLDVEVLMAEGHWFLNTSTLVDGTSINISQNLTCLENSLFQDFVMRFCFSKESFNRAIINGEVINHRDTNVWYQYPVTEVNLENDSTQLTVRVVDSCTAGKFRQEMYVRDEPDHWIVHARMIPIEPYGLYWIRWANRFFKLSLGSRMSSYILMIAPLKKMLWYLGERKGGKPNLQAQGLAGLVKDEVLSFNVQVDVQSKYP